MPGFQSLYVVETAPDEAVLVILADSAATLDRIADVVGNSWMRDNVIPHLAGRPERQVGRVVTTSER